MWHTMRDMCRSLQGVHGCAGFGQSGISRCSRPMHPASELDLSGRELKPKNLNNCSMLVFEEAALEASMPRKFAQVSLEFYIQILVRIIYLNVI